MPGTVSTAIGSAVSVKLLFQLAQRQDDERLRPGVVVGHRQMNVDQVPAGVSASTRARAPPVSASVGWPEAAFTTPMSFM